MFKRVLLASCASGAIGLVATTAHAATADASASAAAAATSSVTELVVTAEKREQSLQHVAIAITAFTAAKRDAIGINSIQDMTNFTPGLTYSTSTDRITLRGVGRTTNVLSADAPVANYDDGLYETFAVAAGRSSLELAQVIVERGPQGTLGGRNALAGSLDEVTQHPTSTPQAEFRWTVGNYGHLTAEAAVSGPINDTWQYRLYGNWDYQVARLDQQHHPRAGVRGQQHQHLVRRRADPGALQRPPRHVDEVPVGRMVQPQRRPGRPVRRLDQGRLPYLRVGRRRHRAERRLRLRAWLHRIARRQSLAGGLQQSGRPLAVDRGDPDRPLGQPACVLFDQHAVDVALRRLRHQVHRRRHLLPLRAVGSDRGQQRADLQLSDGVRRALRLRRRRPGDPPDQLIHLRGKQRLLERRAQLHLDRQRSVAVGRRRLPVLPALPAVGER